MSFQRWSAGGVDHREEMARGLENIPVGTHIVVTVEGITGTEPDYVIGTLVLEGRFARVMRDGAAWVLHLDHAGALNGPHRGELLRGLTLPLRYIESLEVTS